MQRPDRIAAAVLFILLTCARCGSHAAAQPDEVIVARVCWSEGGPSGVECAAIAHVLAERAVMRGVSVRAMAYAYAPRATGRRSYGSRSWVATLHPDRLVRVPGRSAEWVRVRFAALVSVAWEALRGMVPTLCTGAVHWGARWCRACRDRMRVAGLVRVDCPVVNDFFGARREPQTDGVWSGAVRAVCGGAS